MSNHLAIAAVTATLRQMLYDSVSTDVPGTEVTILPPDDPVLKTDGKRLNVYLYHVTPNTASRNADLPGRRQDGTVAAKTRLGLDLYYLFTAYGKASETDPEIHRILGSALRTLHEYPLLTRDAIRAVENQGALIGSNLADQVEMVKLGLQPLSLEDLSRLWSVFFQTPHRISFACLASVVVIEGRETPRPSLPVRERKIYVSPFARPEVFAAEPRTLESSPDARLVLKGRNLSAPSVFVRFGSIETRPEPPVADDRLVVTLPAGLRPGVNSVQVIHKINLGTPPTSHRGFESNVQAFILTPRIVTPPPYNVARGTTLSLNCDPPVGRNQRVALLIGNHEIAIDARPADGASATASLQFPIPADFPPGSYLVRISVDGAESTLQVSPDTTNPVYTGPVLEVTP